MSYDEQIQRYEGYQKTMKAVQMSLLLVSVLFASANAYAAEKVSETAKNGNLYTTPFYHTWNHPPDMYSKRGAGVNSAAITGGYITGIPGFIIGVPVGMVGAFFGQVTSNDRDMSFNYGLNTTSNLFCRLGQHLVGFPALGIKNSINAARANGREDPHEDKNNTTYSRPIR